MLTYSLCAFSDPGIIMAQAFTPIHIDPSLRFCTRCNIYQTDDTFHCNQCDACVLGLDHHW